MTEIGIGRAGTATQNRSPRVEGRPQGSLGGVETEATEKHVGPNEGPLRFMIKNEAGQPVEAPLRDTLRERTVARAQARGALAGTLVAAAGVGVATGVLFGIGKGAAIGTLVGSIIPGAGTVVGAVVGAVVGGLVLGGAAAGIGALIGRLVAGGSDRDRVAIGRTVLVTTAKREPEEADRVKQQALEKQELEQQKQWGDELIAGLVRAGTLIPEEAERLAQVSGSELRGLVSISKDEMASKTARDDIRRAVLMAAATDLNEAKLLKAELLKLPPNRAALGARNIIALGQYLREKQDTIRGVVRARIGLRLEKQETSREAARVAHGLRSHWRSMRDQVLHKARDGRPTFSITRDGRLKFDPLRLNPLSLKALEQIKPPSRKQQANWPSDTQQVTPPSDETETIE